MIVTEALSGDYRSLNIHAFNRSTNSPGNVELLSICLRASHEQHTYKIQFRILGQ